MEVGLLLSYLVDDGGELQGNLAATFEEAINWEGWLVWLSLFIARHLDKDMQGKKMIELVYELEENMAVEIQEGGDSFVDYLLHHKRVSSQTLDEALVDIQKGLSERNYAEAIRY